MRGWQVAERDWLAGRFERNREHLRAVAYSMLGTVSEARDAVCPGRVCGPAVSPVLPAARREGCRVGAIGGSVTSSPFTAGLCRRGAAGWPLPGEMWAGGERGLGVGQEEVLEAGGEPGLVVVGCPSVVGGEQEVQVGVGQC